MSESLPDTEAANHFAEYLNRVANDGECFVLMRGGKPIAELRPLLAGQRLADLPALMASLPRLSVDEASDFATVLTEARLGLSGVEFRDPW